MKRLHFLRERVLLQKKKEDFSLSSQNEKPTKDAWMYLRDELQRRIQTD